MKVLSVVALMLVVAPAIGTPAFADSVRSCADLTDPDSPDYHADRDTWWRFTDERGISCAQGDLSMSEDSVGTSDDDGDDSGSSARGGGAAGTDGGAQPVSPQ